MQAIQLLSLHKRMKEMVGWLTGHPEGYAQRKTSGIYFLPGKS